MNEVRFIIQLHSWWHVGSGEAGADDVDAAVLRDENGLPFTPAKTLVGLFRDAACLRAAFSCERENETANEEKEIARLFGKALPPQSKSENGLKSAGILGFNTAELSSEWQVWAKSDQGRGELDGFFEVLSNTRIENGVAANRSLRRTEVVMPCELHFSIEWNSEDNLTNYLQGCARWIRRLGLHRHRGLGRCNILVPQA